MFNKKFRKHDDDDDDDDLRGCTWHTQTTMKTTR
jgi:hypothetical protein